MKVARRRSARLVSVTALVGVLGVVGCGEGPGGEDGDLPGSPQPEMDAGEGERPDAGGGSDGGEDALDAGEGEIDAGEDAALPEGGDEDLDGGDGAPDTEAGVGDGGDDLPDGGGDDYEPVSPAESMATGRAAHAAVRLGDGRVVVMGGKMSGDTGPKVEIFDPATGAWAAPSVTNAPDYPGSVAHLLSSGEVAVTEPSLSTSLYFYHPETGVFRAGAYPSHATTAPFSALLPSGRALTAGGYTTGGTTVASAQRYDPDANQWSSAKLQEPRRAGLASPLDDETALVMAGRSGLSALFSAELMDTTTGESRYTGSPHEPYDAAERVLLDGGDLLVAGGRDFDQHSQHHVERYSYSTGRFTKVEPMATARQAFTLTKLQDGRVLAIGGRTKDYKALSSVEIYDPVKGEWRKLGDLETPRYRHTATLLDDGRVLVVGGDGASAYLSSVEIIDIEASCAKIGSCPCEAESDALLCARHDSTCATGALKDRCGHVRSVVCNSAPCSGNTVCQSGPSGSSRCVEKTASRFHVEMVSSSNELQVPVAIGVDIRGLPLIVSQGQAVGGTVSTKSTALEVRMPSGRWVRQGLTGDHARLSAASFLQGRAPRVLMNDSSTVQMHLFQWRSNRWERESLNGLYGDRIQAHTLIVNSADRPAFAWIRKAFVVSHDYDVGFTTRGATVVTEEVDQIKGNITLDAVFDGADDPHLVYSNSNAGLIYAKREGGAWSKEVVDTSGGKGARVFIDKSGKVHIVYLVGEGNHEVRHASRTASGWTIEDWALPSAKVSAPRFAMDKDGKVHAVWASFVEKGASKYFEAVSYALRTSSGWAEEPVFHLPNATTLGVNGFALTDSGKPLIVMRYGSLRYFAMIE